MQKAHRVSLGPWLWSAAIWSGIALFEATETVTNMRAMGMHHDWTRLFIMLFVRWLPWAIATPLVLRLARRYPVEQLGQVLQWTRGAMVHLGTCFAIGLLQAAMSATMDQAWNPYLQDTRSRPFLNLWTVNFLDGLPAYLVLYACILTIGYVMDSRARLAQQHTETARLNEQLSKAQLNALRKQIEPHFLFNTLHSVAGLVREQRNDDAVKMIAGLSDFLRHTLEESNAQLTPLADEMQFVHKYLEIQRMRFAERLRLRVDVPQELLSAAVPSLILQPLVENAVKHGIAKLACGGEVRIGAAQMNGTLRLCVYNDGPGFEAAHTGIGLSNLRTRLEGLYGELFELSMRNHERGGVEVTVSVPFREA